MRGLLEYLIQRSLVIGVRQVDARENRLRLRERGRGRLADRIGEQVAQRHVLRLDLAAPCAAHSAVQVMAVAAYVAHSHGQRVGNGPLSTGAPVLPPERMYSEPRRA